MAKWVSISKDNYLKGFDEAVRNIQEAVDKLEHQSVQGLYDALQFVGEEAQRRAPVETGDLRGSMEVHIDGTVGSVSFNTPYAATQHEHTEFDHPHGGQAKFLESVLVEEKDKILDMIAGGGKNSLEG